MPSNVRHIDKTFVDKVERPAKGQVLYKDDKLHGFGLRVTAGSKTYIVEGWVAGKNKSCRFTLGKHGKLTHDEARKLAKQKLGEMAKGEDLNANKKREQSVVRAQKITLAHALDDYLSDHQRLKDSTRENYRRVVNRCFPDWLPKHVADISKDMIADRYKKLSDTKTKTWTDHDNKAQANLAMRVLRALMNFAAGKYEDGEGNPLIAHNPVKRAFQHTDWHKVDRREGKLRAHELKSWVTAVMAMGNRTVAEYLILLLLTGLRKNEAAQLRWHSLDLKHDRKLIIPGENTKNGKPLELPLSDHLVAMLTDRRNRNKKAALANGYVFPGRGSAYLVDPRKEMANVWTKMQELLRTEHGEDAISDRDGLMLHDLRRTYLTIGEALGVPPYSLKRLANHATNSDVTSGYIRIDLESLRIHQQAITSFICSKVGDACLCHRPLPEAVASQT